VTSRAVGANSTKYNGSSRHVEQGIVHRLLRMRRRRGGRGPSQDGSGLVIMVARANDSAGMSKPCQRCTNLLRRHLPNATIVYHERTGDVVKDKVHRLTPGCPTRNRARHE